MALNIEIVSPYLTKEGIDSEEIIERNAEFSSIFSKE
jgi:hypothetical protein